MAESNRTAQTLWTVARIAEHLSVARHRVEYVIDSRDIQPIDRVGIARVFDCADVNRIGAELDRIDAEVEKKRGGGHDA